MSSSTDDLQKCLRLADIADEITMRYFQSVTLGVQTKPDKTPVTDGDLEVDKALHDIVINEFGDKYLSEEGDQTHYPSRQWIVDPIDGTKNFMRRNPVWATLISLQDDNGTIAAVIAAPALGRRWWAARGEGAWTRDVNGTVRQIHVSKVANLQDAYLTYCSLSAWKNTPVGLQPVVDLICSTWRERSFGDALGHAFVAEGVVDACIEPNTKEWDVAAHSFIITEAGGSIFTTATRDTPAAEPRLIITSNGLLEDKLKQALKQ